MGDLAHVGNKRYFAITYEPHKGDDSTREAVEIYTYDVSDGFGGNQVCAIHGGYALYDSLYGDFSRYDNIWHNLEISDGFKLYLKRIIRAITSKRLSDKVSKKEMKE